MITKFLLNNIANILFFLVLFLTLYTDQAVLYAGTIYVLVNVCVLTFRLMVEQGLWRNRLFLLQQIVYNATMGLSAYENDITYFAVGIAVYHALITFACWWLQRRGEYFVERYEPHYLYPIARLEAMGVEIQKENRKSTVKAVNELYLRNSFVLSCLYVVILPATNLSSQSWYVLWAFIFVPICNWYLIANLTVKVFSYFKGNIGVNFEETIKQMQAKTQAEFAKQNEMDPELAAKVEDLKEYIENKVKEQEKGQDKDK